MPAYFAPAPPEPAIETGSVSVEMDREHERLAEFSEQARKLHQLGNSVEAIRATLERVGADPAEARVALASIARAEAARQRRFRQTLQFVGGAALVILLALVAVALVMSQTGP